MHDSTYDPVVEVPSSAPNIVAKASDVRALLILGIFPFLSMSPLALPSAISVAMVSNMSIINSTNITGIAFIGSRNGNEKSRLKKVCDMEFGNEKTLWGAVANFWPSVPVIKNDAIVMRAITRTIAGLNFRASKTAIIKKPAAASRHSGLDRLPAVDIVNLSATINFDDCKPK